MTTDHTVTFTMRNDGLGSYATFECHATPDAPCRNRCDQDCCENVDDVWHNPEHNAPGQECVYLPWLFDAATSYEGPDSDPIRVSPAPVHCTWHVGGYCTWAFAEQEDQK